MMISPIVAEYLETGKCESTRVIDLHAHFGPFSGIYMPNSTPEQMIATMGRCGVETIVTSGHLALSDMVRGNAEIAEISVKYPGAWYGYMVYNPNYPELGRRELELFQSRPSFVGIKFHPSGHAYPITGENYGPALEFAASNNLIVLTHTWGHSAFDSPQMLAEVAGRYPTVPFLAGHSGFGDFGECMRVAAEFPNIYLELTAAYAVRGVIEDMVARTGAHKIIFGCDLPWFDPHYAIGSVIMADITDEARRAILRENGLRLLAGRTRV